MRERDSCLFFFFCLTASPAGRLSYPIVYFFPFFMLRAVYCDRYLCQRAAIPDSDVPPPSDVPSLLTRPPPSNMSPSFRLLAQRHGRARWWWSRGLDAQREPRSFCPSGSRVCQVSVFYDISRKLLGPLSPGSVRGLLCCCMHVNDKIQYPPSFASIILLSRHQHSGPPAVRRLL